MTSPWKGLPSAGNSFRASPTRQKGRSLQTPYKTGSLPSPTFTGLARGNPSCMAIVPRFPLPGGPEASLEAFSFTVPTMGTALEQLRPLRSRLLRPTDGESTLDPAPSAGSHASGLAAGRPLLFGVYGQSPASPRVHTGDGPLLDGGTYVRKTKKR